MNPKTLRESCTLTSGTWEYSYRTPIVGSLLLGERGRQVSVLHCPSKRGEDRTYCLKGLNRLFKEENLQKRNSYIKIELK